MIIITSNNVGTEQQANDIILFSSRIAYFIDCVFLVADKVHVASFYRRIIVVAPKEFQNRQQFYL